MTPRSFAYRNPIYSPAWEALRDPQILRVGGAYYMTGSQPPYWGEGPNPGVRLWRSDDLLSWEVAADLVRRDDMPDDAWCRDRFWSPEIHARGGRFYLTFTARNEARQTGWGQGLAVSERIEGPYRLVTRDAPLRWGGIDLSLFTDEDGRSYGYHSGAGGIVAAEIDLDRGAYASGPVPCVQMIPGTWEDRVMEGPFVIRRRGRYYLFYSCGARGYEVGYAVADRPLGPWTKAPGNPLFGVQNAESCRKMGIAFTGDPDCRLLFAGHNAVFPGPDGGDWVCYLVQEKGRRETLAIDPIRVEKGLLRTPAPTWTPQKVSLGEAWRERPAGEKARE